MTRCLSVLALAAALITATLPAIGAAPRSYRGTVSYVSDGDTLWVRPDGGGRPRKLRLQGLDAPEICQPGGAAARDALRAMALRQRVQVAVLGRDDYRRAVARVTRGSDDLGRSMVRQGLAWSYRFRGDPGPYVREERAARAARRGLFELRPGQPAPEQPRDFRRRHGPCAHP